MKYIILILMLGSTAHATEPDKQKHFAASAGIASLAYIAGRSAGYSKTESYLTAVGMALSVGLVKELFDGTREGNKFDWEDMGYNALGAAAVPVLVIWY